MAEGIFKKLHLIHDHFWAVELHKFFLIRQLVKWMGETIDDMFEFRIVLLLLYKSNSSLRDLQELQSKRF